MVYDATKYAPKSLSSLQQILEKKGTKETQAVEEDEPKNHGDLRWWASRWGSMKTGAAV